MTASKNPRRICDVFVLDPSTNSEKKSRSPWEKLEGVPVDELHREQRVNADPVMYWRPAAHPGFAAVEVHHPHNFRWQGPVTQEVAEVLAAKVGTVVCIEVPECFEGAYEIGDELVADSVLVLRSPDGQQFPTADGRVLCVDFRVPGLRRPQQGEEPMLKVANFEFPDLTLQALQPFYALLGMVERDVWEMTTAERWAQQRDYEVP